MVQLLEGNSESKDSGIGNFNSTMVQLLVEFLFNTIVYIIYFNSTMVQLLVCRLLRK